MTMAPTPRAHLVERAIQAMGGGLRDLLVPISASNGAVDVNLRPSPSSAGHDDPIAWEKRPAISMADLTKAGLVVAQQGSLRTRISEEVAIVQHAVVRSLGQAASKAGQTAQIVLVTSARPGEGKSFMALNVAASIALTRPRGVILVDGDGKRGSISELLGCGTAPGLRDIRPQTQQQLMSMLLPTEITRLSVLPSGAVPCAAWEPSGTDVATPITRLSEAMPDHILVLDSPPCLSTSDATAYATLASQVLMVVEAERTQRNEVEAALDMVDACPLVQLVLNRAQMTANNTFGAYGYGVYGAYGAQAGI